MLVKHSPTSVCHPEPTIARVTTAAICRAGLIVPLTGDARADERPNRYVRGRSFGRRSALADTQRVHTHANVVEDHNAAAAGSCNRPDRTASSPQAASLLLGRSSDDDEHDITARA
jgi:hypothetical protein